MRRALGDPSAKVRAWAAKAASRLPLTPADGRGGSDSDAEVGPSIGPGLASGPTHRRYSTSEARHLLERATPGV